MEMNESNKSSIPRKKKMTTMTETETNGGNKPSMARKKKKMMTTETNRNQQAVNAEEEELNQSLFDQDNDSFDILLIVVAVVGKQTIQSIQQLLVLVLVVVQLIVLLLVNYYYHSPHPFNRIYQSISLLCRTGSFTLSLSLFFFYHSLPVVPILFVFFFLLLLQSYISIPLSILCRTGSFPLSLRVVAVVFLLVFFIYLSLLIVTYRIFSPLFTCCSSFFRSYLSIHLSIVSYRMSPPPLFTCRSLFDRIFLSVSLSWHTGSFALSLRVDSFLVHVLLHSSVSFYPSLYHGVPDLFLSLYVPCWSFSCSSSSYSSSFNRIYISVSLSCRTGSFFHSLRVLLVLVRVLLLRRRTPTDDTPTPSLLWSWNRYLIW